ncbi:hypothetical protein Fmac_031269 [Flemingia macrophylla]|uniref:NB-ARC domain-containing protein n=1 Tax=Flemingia macrophylla TaxID=520843 RepID=A0ABD1L214_9FABA
MNSFMIRIVSFQMEDILISVAAKIAEYTVDPIFHHAQYMCCFNNFVEKFLNAKRELESTQESVKERVKQAINRTEEIQPTVEEWLKDVENVLKEMQETEKRILEIIVSETLNIRNIQDQIADQLGFKFEVKSNEGRAQRLSQRLCKGTTLLILDDVWETLDFEALGIPLNENNKGCRVLLTTRKREVCTSMQRQSIIELKILTNEEAWTLFTSHAEIVDESPDALKDVARQIVNECKGLPIAIVTVGSTLRGKSIVEWESALSRLKDSKPLVTPKGLRKDHEIDLENLFRFGWGRGLFKTFGTIEKARKELCVAINILKGSCLLLHVDDYKVKMHDMVRDVALCIAFEMDEPILASNVVDPRILVEDDIIKDKRVISLWDLENGHLLNDAQFNISLALETLVLQYHNDHLELSSVFQRLKMLKILALFYEGGYRLDLTVLTLSLSHSMGSLENLRTLCLNGYKLGNMSILGSLQALEILELCHCCFEELPNGIVALKKLKLIDILCCEIEKNNACEVIGGCLQLEELYLSLDNPFIEEFWPHNFSSRLQSFDVPAKMNDLFLRAEVLYLRNLVGGYKNIIPSMDPKGMNQLTDLAIEDCGEIECLFDNVDMLEIELVFSSLLTILLVGLYNLRQVFSGSYSRCFLKELQEMHITNCQQLYNISFPRNSKLCNHKKMTINYCPELTSLFTPSVFQTLQQLEVLQIFRCSELKHIIEEVSSQSHTSLPLSKLRSLQIGDCSELEYLFPRCLAPALTSLETLDISDNRKLKYENETLWLVAAKLDNLCDQMLCAELKYLILGEVGVEVEGVFQFQMEELGSNKKLLVPLNLSLTDVHLSHLPHLKLIWNGPTNFLNLQLLQEFNVNHCPKLKTIFSPTVVRSLPMLRWLKIYNCEELVQIFDSGDVQELKSLYTCSQQKCFPKLETIIVRNCNKLKFLFYNFAVGHFPGLWELKVEECSQLEKVFAFECEIDGDGQEGRDMDEGQVKFSCLSAAKILMP